MKLNETLNVAIVGCGEIAHKHATFVKSIKNVRIVGAVDNNLNRLVEFSEKYGIDNYYQDIKKFLDSQKVDIVHITTPPFLHRELALEAISKGAHVYIEKPVALNSEETKEIYRAAGAANVKVCVGCNFMFEPSVLKAMDLVNSPSFGKVRYIEYFYGNNMRRYDRRMTTASNEIHWSYYLPGGFHQNYISHPLYMVTRFTGKPESVHIACSSCGALPQNLTDEIRVLIQGKQVSGLVALSYSCEPYQHYIKIFGEKQTVIVDVRSFVTSLIRKGGIPDVVLRLFYNNLSTAIQLSSGTLSNIWNFARKKAYPYKGMRTLFERFYESVRNDAEPPVPESLAITAEEISDEIWKNSSGLHLNFDRRPSRQVALSKKKHVLVTGASGFVGEFTVKRLVSEGYKVRAFVRKLSHISELEKLGVEIYFGDIRHYDSLKKAAQGVGIVIHLASAMNVPKKEYEAITVGGTKNLVQICEELEIPKVVYVSSMSVYDRKHCRNNDVLDENYMLEKHAKERGAYTASKVEAERFLHKSMAKSKTQWVVLRPSIIYGPGKAVSFKQIGGMQFGYKLRIVFGSGKNRLRITHVEDVVEAIVLTMENEQGNGQIYNVEDSNSITKRDYIKEYLQRQDSNGLIVYIPYPIVYSAVFLQELLFRAIGRDPFMTRYRLMASQKNLFFDSNKIQAHLGWKAKFSLISQKNRSLDVK